MRVGSHIVTGVNTHKYILLMKSKECLLKKKQKKVLYFVKCTSFNDVLRYVFIYFLPEQNKNTFVYIFVHQSNWKSFE
jgi:hypothetical protein